jgi:predicted nucleotidyltransferase
MDAIDIVQTLKREFATLRSRFGVKSLGLFGSIARGEASPGSDVDILVDFDAPSFDHYMDLKFYLEERLGRRVDLVLKGSLKPALRERILREVRDVA